jgi:hypothetical protein
MAITIENVKELSGWLSDLGFVADVHAVFSAEHDITSVLTDYTDGEQAQKFAWGVVVYTVNEEKTHQVDLEPAAEPEDFVHSYDYDWCDDCDGPCFYSGWWHEGDDE